MATKYCMKTRDVDLALGGGPGGICLFGCKFLPLHPQVAYQLMLWKTFLPLKKSTFYKIDLT